MILCILGFTCTQQIIKNPAETITVEELRDHVFYLASDSLQGRMPGTEGYNTAARYAASRFLQAGLEPG